MNIYKVIQTLFLAAAVSFECYLVFAASLYVPWRSASFLVVGACGAGSILFIVYYVLTFDRAAGRSRGQDGALP